MDRESDGLMMSFLERNMRLDEEVKQTCTRGFSAAACEVM